MQFGFMPGRGMTNALFVVRRMHDEYRDKKKKLHKRFVCIEKVFDGVRRKVMEWVMRKKGLPEVIARAVMCLHGAKTKVRVGSESSEEFLLQVGVHQSVLSPLLFAITVDEITENAREDLVKEILQADDLVLMSESVTNKEICLVRIVLSMCMVLCYLFARLLIEKKNLVSSKLDLL